jgi:DNA-binding response OmpR family regulator
LITNGIVSGYKINTPLVKKFAMNLLIIEDSIRLQNSLSRGLTNLSYVVDSASDGAEGLNFAKSKDYDLIVLDIMLPKIDGLTVLKKLRESNILTPILILSARDDIQDRVKGLELGADDYLCKPFAFDELVARIKTLTRRNANQRSPLLLHKGVTINFSLKQITVNAENISFTPIEYLILERLLLNRNVVIPYASMTDKLSDIDGFISQNTLEAHVSSVRKKLKAKGITDFLQTRRGFGYFVGS